MDSMETVRTIVQTMQSLGPEVLGKAPAIAQEVARLASILPKIVVGGDQSTGKSALLNKLMPDCVQGTVRLRSLHGMCTLSTTTIAFVRSNALSITITSRNGEQRWSHEMKDATTWLANELKKIQEEEATTQSLFQFETNIVVKHPEILVDYAIIDMPGLRPGASGSSEIETQFERLIKDADLFLAADLANKDLDTLRIIRPDTLKKLKSGAKTILVLTKADGITNPETLPAMFESLQARKDLYKYALTCTLDDKCNDEHEKKVLAEKTAAIEVTEKYISGTATLRSELEHFYRELVAAKYPEALEAANGLKVELKKHIETIKPGMEEKTGIDLITLSKKLIVDPACFARNSGLVIRAANAMRGCEQPYDRKWLERTFAEQGNQKGKELVAYVMSKTSELRQGRVRGTEGLYNYLLTSYEIICEEILIDPCTEKLKEEFLAMKTETIRALREQVRNNRQFNKIVDHYCKYVGALDTDPKPGLAKFLKQHEPTSDIAYPHNYAAKVILGQMEEALAKYRKENRKEGEMAGEALDALQVALEKPLGFLAQLSLNSDNIVMENVQNVILWYWEEVFSRELIGKMKALVGAFHEEIRNTLDRCQEDMISESAADPDAFKSPIDPADQKTLEVLESALSRLEGVAGRTASPPPGGVHSTSHLAASSEQTSDLRAGFRGLSFWQ